MSYCSVCPKMLSAPAEAGLEHAPGLSYVRAIWLLACEAQSTEDAGKLKTGTAPVLTQLTVWSRLQKNVRVQKHHVEGHGSVTALFMYPANCSGAPVIARN